jgi:T5orf172 domain
MCHTISDLLGANISKMSAEELEAHIANLRRVQKKDLRQLLADEAYGRPEYEGFIYILSNPSMPGILKIGYTSGTVEKRAAELSSPSGVPEAYTIEKTFAVYSTPRDVEKKVHRVLNARRVSHSREFFRLSLDDAVFRIQAVFAGAFDALYRA